MAVSHSATLLAVLVGILCGSTAAYPLGGDASYQDFFPTDDYFDMDTASDQDFMGTDADVDGGVNDVVPSVGPDGDFNRLYQDFLEAEEEAFVPSRHPPKYPRGGRWYICYGRGRCVPITRRPAEVETNESQDYAETAVDEEVYPKYYYLYCVGTGKTRRCSQPRYPNKVQLPRPGK